MDRVSAAGQSMRSMPPDIILAKRRYVTHTVSLTMTRDGSIVAPGDIVQIKLDLETTDGDGVNDEYFYQVDSVREGQKGLVYLTLTHFPVDGSGVSIIAKEVHAGSVSIQ